MAKKVREVPEPLFREQLNIRPEDIMPQCGLQEEVLLSDSDITFCGSSRGGGKSYALILDAMYDIHNPMFGAMFFRKETGELEKAGGLYDKASKIYPILGAKPTKLKFVFPSGAYIMMDHLQNEDEKAIEKRFKGLEIPAIYIDEVDQIEFSTFLKLLQSNRNSSGIRNRIVATLNPAPDSWVRQFLDFYINEEGYIDPDRDCQTIYFYVYGTTVNDILWAESKELLYEKAQNYIDSAWREEFYAAGLTKFDLIKSLKFVKGDVSQNKKLLESQPSYIANIAQGGAAAIARNLDGNWNIKADGVEMVKRNVMQRMFDPDRHALTNGVKYATIDVALLGLDNFIIIIWDNLHITDVICRERLDSGSAIALVAATFAEYGIRESNCAFDNVGNGQVLTCYKKAVPINAMAAPIGKEIAYDNLKSQLMYTAAKYLIEEKITCSPNAAQKLFNYGKGTTKSKLTFQEILQNERRALMQAESTGKTKMLNKKEMKKILGGISPDFLEAVAYRMVFELDKKQSKGFQGLEYL